MFLSKLERSRIVFLLLFVASLWLAIRGCFRGIGLADEAVSIVFGWKLFPLGDKPLVTEIYSAARLFDLLNYYLLRPWVPYSVLWIRISSLLIYVACLLVFIRVFFGKFVGLTAGLLFTTCLLSITHETEWWNYNTWARNLLLLHFVFLFLYFEKKNSKLLFVAGIAASIAFIAYLPQAILAVLSTLILLSLRQKVKYYFWGFLIPLLVLGAYFLQAQLFPHFQNAFIELSQLQVYKGSKFQKAMGLLRFVFNTPELWFIFLTQWAKRVKTPLFVALLIFLLARFPLISNGFETARTLVALSFAFGILLLFKSKRNNSPFLLLCSLTGMAATFTFGMASASGSDSLQWGVPALLLTFLAGEVQKSEAKSYLILILTLALCIGSIKRNLHLQDREGRELVKIENIPPLNGLHTNPRKLFLLKEVRRSVEEKDFALSYNFFPAPFYFGKVRSSLNSIVLQTEELPSLRGKHLHWMKEQGRFPETIIRLRQMGDDWGVKSPSPIQFPEHDVFNRYTDCVKKDTLLDEPEIQILSVDPKKTQDCLNY